MLMLDTMKREKKDKFSLFNRLNVKYYLPTPVVLNQDAVTFLSLHQDLAGS